MDDFYAARSRTIPPLPWSNIAPPFSLVVSFRSGGLRELADHLFTWGGSVVIDGPQELRDMMHERLMLAAGACEQAATGSDVLACNQ
ncbi:putative DNA-binding transcriptional regulator YafY [Sphingobium francense]|nr:putative DNA-binding transcriptional regulator YafY [Sphingobium indicum]